MSAVTQATHPVHKPSKANRNGESLSLPELRKLRPAHRKIRLEGVTIGERISDAVASTVGSWTFIIIQSSLLLLWLLLNVISWIRVWDPYPFILLNLLLSFQAAFTAPIIMMSQNRQNAIDRKKVENDYTVNVKAEMEIELLHQKIDALKEQEIKQLIDIISDLEKKITLYNTK
ncbi:MAG: DUF1003 domain-containing protein [Alphaproteobacteria bacterium]|nr:DUF1003 domain-containing protein [Alphaproteobacteria bacterium]